MAKTAATEKLNVSIPWPFAAREVKLNTDTNLLKLIAMATMLIDHAGKMLFPQYYVLRVIGRIAFPLYAYCLAVGCVYTKNPLRYLTRIVLLALISQPLYAVALGHTVPSMYSVSFAEHPVRAALQFYTGSWNHPSLLLSLSLGMILIWTIREKHLVLSVAIVLFCYLTQASLDYGIRGIILMTLFYLFCAYPLISFPVVAAYMIWWGLQGSGFTLFDVRFGSQMFAVLALPLIYLPIRTHLRMNKWVFYLFYPAHLALIYLVDTFLM